MKLFGWGKSKGIQPQTVLQQDKNSDPRSSSRHGLNRGASMGPKMPCKGAGIRNKQQGLFGVDDDGYLDVPRHKVDAPLRCDEKLKDTIKFIFSHEQEGLLAIGTFALEQLTAVRNAIDEHYQKTTGQDEYESCTGMMQSSDDEDASWLTSARKNMPVYGSDAASVESDGDQSKALALYKSNRTPIAGVKPIVLLTALPPELRKVFNPANLLYRKSNFVPHWTDSVARRAHPLVQLARADEPCADDESYYTSRFCGLFGSKKKGTIKRLSKRGTVYIDNDDSEKKLAVSQSDAKKSLLSGFGSNGMPSNGKLAKMWRTTCKQSSGRIAPERNPCSRRPSQIFQGPLTGIERGEVITAPALQPQDQSAPRRLPAAACSPKVAEFRRRVAMQQERNNLQARSHEGEVVRNGVGLNRDDGGHWIKTDSKFVVLEM